MDDEMKKQRKRATRDLAQPVRHLVSRNRSQVTIFIIIALVIVAIVVLFFVLRGHKGPGTGGDEGVEPETFLDTCLKEGVFEAIDVIGKQGGYVDPTKADYYINFKFTGTNAPVKIPYLCYTDQFRDHCQTREPMLIKHVESEIKKYIRNDTDNCFDALGKKFNDEGYTTEVRYIPGNFDVQLRDGSIRIKINGEFVLTKTGQTRREKDFEVKVPSELFEILIFPVQEILRRKATAINCYFDSPSYGLFYPEFDIDSEVNPQDLNTTRTREDSTQIYRIEHEKTKETFRFAVRSCVSIGGYEVQGG